MNVYIKGKILNESIQIKGDNNKDTIKGAFFIEFHESISNGKVNIQRHLKSNGYDENKIHFRTHTITRLHHGHSFVFLGDHTEEHVLTIPGAKSIYRVSTIFLFFA